MLQANCVTRHFTKCLKIPDILRNAQNFQAFHEMPRFELHAFQRMPKSDDPVIFSLSPVTTGVKVACIGSGLGISEDQRVCYLLQWALTYWAQVTLPI